MPTAVPVTLKLSDALFLSYLEDNITVLSKVAVCVMSSQDLVYAFCLQEDLGS